MNLDVAQGTVLCVLWCKPFNDSLHLLTKGLPGCAFGIKIGHSFQKKATPFGVAFFVYSLDILCKFHTQGDAFAAAKVGELLDFLADSATALFLKGLTDFAADSIGGGLGCGGIQIAVAVLQAGYKDRTGQCTAGLHPVAHTGAEAFQGLS